MKKLIFLSIFFAVAALNAAQKLTDYIDTKDTYLIAYVNADSIRSSNIYSAIKTNLPGKLNSSDIVSAYYPAAAANGLTESDLSEAVMAVDILQNKPLMKETIGYQLAIKLKKDISKDDLVSILTSDPSDKGNFTTKQMVVGLMKVTEIQAHGDSMFVYMPDSKTVFASDNINSLSALTSRYKSKNPTQLPDRMKEQQKLLSSDPAVYVIGAVPPAVKTWLEEEDSKIPANSQPQDLFHSIRAIIKNLVGVTFTAQAGDTLDVKAVAIFMNQDAPNILNGIVNQYMPLLKLQVFMMAQNNTQMPGLNTVANSVDGNNFVLTFSLCGDDIQGIMNLSKENQKLNFNVNQVNIQN